MRILVVTQYFWPENFKINDVCLGLIERGHSVTVLTGKPNYPTGRFFKGYSFWNRRKEQFNGMTVLRCPLITRGKGGGGRLFLNYFSFAFSASVRILFMGNRYDRIFVYQPSPVTVGIPAIVAKWHYKAPIFFWVNDLWPESIKAAGGITNKAILHWIDKLSRFIYHHSKHVLAQSPTFHEYLLKQNVPVEKIVYFPQVTESFYKMIPESKLFKGLFPKGFNILFAGNIGVAQSFDTLLQAAQRIHQKYPLVNWIILGDGRMKSEVAKQAEQLGLKKCFLLLGSYPSEDMPHFFSLADALFIALKKSEIFSLTIPAKLQSYLACGKPIIGAIDGIGATIINEAACGVTSPAEDVDALVSAMELLILSDKQTLDKMGSNARIYFEAEFERELLLSRLERILA